ncbi:hypothetical protein G6F68_021267 [Rhizopus microsporus]|nr:hypothetical protein G6F68_021267 [Rhizopus microsporus]
MEADDPTDIANIRRSLIQQEFPYSDISHYSAAQLQRTTTEEEDDENHDDSQQQPSLSHLVLQQLGRAHV